MTSRDVRNQALRNMGIEPGTAGVKSPREQAFENLTQAAEKLLRFFPSRAWRDIAPFVALSEALDEVRKLEQ